MAIHNNLLPTAVCSACKQLSTSTVLQRKLHPNEPKRWTRYNDIVYPPQKEMEPRRPAVKNYLFFTMIMTIYNIFILYDILTFFLF